jgi:hypothetical protein
MAPELGWDDARVKREAAAWLAAARIEGLVVAERAAATTTAG